MICTYYSMWTLSEPMRVLTSVSASQRLYSLLVVFGGFSRVTGLRARTPDRTTSSRGSVWNRPQRQIFGPHSGASRSLLYARSLPLSFSYLSCFLVLSILLSLPFSYCRCVLHTTDSGATHLLYAPLVFPSRDAYHNSKCDPLQYVYCKHDYYT